MIITDGQARRIASEWHGGAMSALYSFTSTGAIDFQPLKDEIMQNVRDLQPMTTDTIPYRDDLFALMHYVREKGPRDKQEGWFGTWDDTPVSVPVS